MIEHRITWTCDRIGCDAEQEALVWANIDRPHPELTVLDGWTLKGTLGEYKTYCRRCSAEA